jgi:hypothetical protein
MSIDTGIEENTLQLFTHILERDDNKLMIRKNNEIFRDKRRDKRYCNIVH